MTKMKDRHMIRVYDKTKNKFSTINIESLIDNCEIESCTGLRDKNGSLIFEGDIIRVTHCEGEEGVYTVKWFGEEMGYPAFDIDSLIDFGDCNDLSYVFDSGNYDVEVIGNRWENINVEIYK